MRPDKMNGLQNMYEAAMNQSQITRQIIHNSIQTPDGTVLVSRSVHDYKTHIDKNGKTYMIDGGRDYIRSSANGDEVYLTLYTDSPHSEVREVFTWGTYGKHGTDPLTLKKLKDLTRDHIEAILKTQSHIPKYIRDLFKKEIVYRIEGGSKPNG